MAGSKGKLYAIWLNSPLQAKGIAIVSLPVLCLLVVLVLVGDLQTRAVDARRAIVRTEDTLREINADSDLAHDAESDLRIYAATGGPYTFKRYRERIHQLNDGLERLAALVADNPRQTARVRGVANRFLDLFPRVTSSSFTPDSVHVVDPDALAEVFTRFKMFKAEEQDILRDEHELLMDSHQNMRVLVYILGFFGLLGGFVGAFLFSTGISRRLDRVASNAERLAHGSRLQAPDESEDAIGKLGRRVVAAAEMILEREKHLRESRNDVQKARLKAEEAAKAKSEFLASMTHEIRSPMHAIVGTGDLLAASGLTLEQQEYVRVLQRASNNLLSVINDILDLSKIEAGKIDLEYAPVDFAMLCDRVIDINSTLSEKKGIELICEYPSGVPNMFMGDGARLQRILMNLVSNAIKFTVKGTVRVKVDFTGTGSLHFSVADNGIGIPPRKLEVIFEKFTQVDSSTTRKFGGTGLGLAICKQLVDLMKGRIWAESEGEGRGATFHVELPLEIADKDQALKLKHLDGARVLIADDREINRAVLRKMLEEHGAITEEAMDGIEAVLAIEVAGSRNRQFDLVLLDYHMPGLNGIEVYERTATMLREADTPVILLTSDNTSRVISRFKESQITRYLVKPIRAAELAATIQGVFASRARASQPVPVEAAAPEVRLRVLLADDSEDNVFLMRAFLSGPNWDLDIAEDGQVAFEKFQSSRYDIVLMDAQMPRLDGLSATRMIRDWERANGRRRVPLICLTANAFLEDAENAIAAGADAHLSKPIQRDALIGALRLHTKGHQMAEQRIKVPDEVRDLAPMFLRRQRHALSSLRTALSSCDFENVRVFAHNLKGNGRSYGFPELSLLGSEMELAAREQDSGVVSAVFGKISEYLNTVEVA
jgi:signal transduction histidine kinase/DNA-binding response OmpR family regulator